MNEKEMEYKMVINNSGSDNGIVIDNLFVRLINDTYYGIDQFCITDTNITDSPYDDISFIHDEATYFYDPAI